jgi:hypothetical protein
MKVSDSFNIFSQLINFVIFIYLILVLAKITALDASGLLISAFGLLVSIILSILSAVGDKD